MLLLFPLLPACGPGDQRPSLLFVSIDTLRADALGIAGADPDARTPCLDDLARQGTYVARARSHVPLTLPSHATMMTGLLPPAHGLHDNAPFALAAGTPTLATRLAEEGYHTIGVVGGAPLARPAGLAQGFAAWSDPPGTTGGSLTFGERTAFQVTEAALALLATAPDSPTFLFAHYFDPHQPYAPPSRFTRADASPRERYRGEVGFVDEQVGRLLQAIGDEGRRWLVVITSDHGEGLGDHGEDTHGYFVFDSTMEVPLILAEVEDGAVLPWSPLADRTLEQARLVDLCPTILARLQLEPLPGCQGMDLALAKGLSPPAYVESLAANLHFRWAQITGVHTHRGALWLAGSPTGVTPLPEQVRRVPGTGARWDDGEFLVLPQTDTEPDEGLAQELRQALGALRQEGDAGGDEGMAALHGLGYLTSSEDRSRHRLLPPAANAELPSPLDKVGFVRILLQAVQDQSAGDGEASLRQLRMLTLEDPGNPSARFFLARGILEEARRRRDQGLAEAALDQLGELLRVEPDHPAGRQLRVQALGLCGRFGPALEAAKALCEQAPTAAHEELLGSVLVEARSLDGSVSNPLRDLREGVEHLLRAVEAGATHLTDKLGSLLDHPALADVDPSWKAEVRERLAASRRSGS